ncbi:MAG TPA: amino acid deaminase/aldolase [Aeromicrobium sp.]|nr:amino acid deaminase/aldolase [Aeromicrobium sp.]HKY58459.1 amino acid deaminase/aldolase [Aeromicrobium sp.]
MVLDLSGVTPTPMSVATLDALTEHLEPPFAVVDLGALKSNAGAMAVSARSKPIRLASKSVRCREITRAVLAMPGYCGILALTLAEALWLAEEVDDVVVGYPTADRERLTHLADSSVLARRVTLMVDSVDQLDFIETVVGATGERLRVCIDLDASLRLLGGKVHLGPRRSPLHDPAAAAEFARAIVARDRFELVGLMAYEGHIAGVGDDAGSLLNKVQIRAMQRVSSRELRERRAEVVAAVRSVASLVFVNGGGTGSIAATVSEDAITEVAAGSGLYCPTLFDGYRHLNLEPSAYFVTSVVRRPSPEFATVLGGGWVASGAAGTDRLPTPVWPRDLKLTGLEGAGEAQTPLHGRGARHLRPGERVWFRHAKAGELCERVNELHLVADGEIVGTVPTYRGEGKAFL